MRGSQEERFWDKVDRRDADDCWPWTGAIGSTGYGALRPSGKRAGPCVKAHRYSAELAGYDISQGSVLHSCDNRACVNPAHLRVGTQRENVADMMQRDRGGMGSLATVDVYTIRALRARGIPRTPIAKHYGVTEQAVTNASTGTRHWRHLPDNPSPAIAEAVAVNVAHWIGRRVAAGLGA